MFLVQGVLVTMFSDPLAALDRWAGNRHFVGSFLLLLAAVAASAIMLRSIDTRPVDDLGAGRRGARPRALLEGTALGIATIGLGSGLLLLVGWLRIVPSGPGSSLDVALRLSVFLLMAALAEEILMRGYLLTALREGLGDAGALIATSTLFGIAHLFNEGVTLQSFLLVSLAGIFLGAIRIVLDSLYAAWLAHAAWNWTMAVGLHAPVSGIVFDSPDYRLVSQGPDWVTGGTWGPEGGVIAGAGMLAGLAYLYRAHRRGKESSQ